MKNIKIVLSFDDGRADFYQNVFPLLKKYKIKATLNIITGFIDKSVIPPYEVCQLNELREMFESGLVEMAMHSNSHLHSSTACDFEVCFEKMRNWFPQICSFGIAMPFNQYPSPEIINFAKEKSIPYIRIGFCPSKKRLSLMFYKLFGIKQDFLSKSLVTANENAKKRKGLKYYYSIPIDWKRNVDEYIKIINQCDKNKQNVLVFMFHSIINDNCDIHFKEGAWTISKFETLLKYISDEGFETLKQEEI